MKKHQKVLLGIMALSLAGGTGTAVALKFTGASSSQAVPTDDAIYLYWGTKEQNTGTQFLVNKFVSGEAQYRGLVVAPKSSTTIPNGKVTVKFELSASDPNAIATANEDTASTPKYTLAGLTVKVYEVNGFEFVQKTGVDATAYQYEYSSQFEKETPEVTLDGAKESSSGSVTFGVTDAEDDEEATTSESTLIWNHYYTLEFVWDGTPAATGYTFGGVLTITQSFSDAA